MKVKDKNFELYISSQKIKKKVKELAQQINKDYKGRHLLFISILNGSYVFTADLLREIDLSCEVSFIKIASYSKMESTGNLQELIGLNENIFQRDVILVEDIMDSGKTMKNLLEKMESLGPNSVEVATLLMKPEALETGLAIKYIGFEIPQDFVVGYGLDYDGAGRNLKDIYQFKEIQK